MTGTVNPAKPLGQKAYGHIGHLPGSRMGPGDHAVHPGQERIATVKSRDRHDIVVVQEKLDGSCVSVAKVNGEIVPLGRAGYRAVTSPFYQHILFHSWALAHWQRFDELLREGERVVGEWLAQAHGTRYDLTLREPFVPFDLMTGIKRVPHGDGEFNERVERLGFAHPAVVSVGPAHSVADAMAGIGTGGFYGALDPVEGAVWRVERKGVVDFLAKYVRPDKVDGSYLPETSAGIEAGITGPVWNWQPEEAAA